MCITALRLSQTKAGFDRTTEAFETTCEGQKSLPQGARYSDGIGKVVLCVEASEASYKLSSG
jgi:hypothetical protein